MGLHHFWFHGPTPFLVHGPTPFLVPCAYTISGSLVCTDRSQTEYYGSVAAGSVHRPVGYTVRSIPHSVPFSLSLPCILSMFNQDTRYSTVLPDSRHSPQLRLASAQTYLHEGSTLLRTFPLQYVATAHTHTRIAVAMETKTPHFKFME